MTEIEAFVLGFTITLAIICVAEAVANREYGLK